MSFRTAAALALVSCALGCGSAPTSGPSMAARRSGLPEQVPIAPLIFGYQVWDHHFIQWLETGPFETAELLVEEGPERASVWVFLTERARGPGGKAQLHFSNDPALVRRLSAPARRVQQVPIEYRRSEDASGCRMSVSLSTEHGPLVWQFSSQGAPQRRHGDRLVDVVEHAHDLAGGLLVFYLADSAVAAKSTRFRLGDVEHVIHEWPELSRAPYFMAYRGVYSRPAHVGYFPSMSRTTIHKASGPAESSGGASWSYDFTTEAGAEATPLEVVLERRGERWIFASDGFDHETERMGDEFVTGALVARDGEARMELRFEPGLRDLAAMADGSQHVAWKLGFAGKPDRLSGELAIEKRGAAISVLLRPLAPRWARALPLEAQLTLQDRGYTYAAQTLVER